MSKIVDGIVKDIKSVPEKAEAKFKGGNLKKLLLLNFPYLLFAYVFNKMAWLYRISTKEAALDKVLDMINRIDRAFANPLPSFHLQDVLIGAAGGIVIMFAVYYKAKNAKKFRHGMECGKMLLKNGYKVKVLNTINFKKSMHYNPFAYIRSEKDILKLVNTIIANTKGEGQQSGEDFWVNAEKLYYTALIGYIWYECVEEEQNFTTLLDMINASEVREDDEEFKNPVDLMFEELEAKDPNHFAVRQYKKYKLATGKTAKSILISCGARLAPFDIKGLRDLTSYDELELDKLGEEKSALFVIISDTDDTFNFIVSIMYTQLFNLLCDKADDVYSGKLPIPVRCLLDEFAVRS